MFLLPSSKPSIAGLPGDKVMQKSLQAAAKAGTAHLAVVSRQAGRSQTETMDISATGGLGTATIGGQQEQVLVVNKSLYLRCGTLYLTQVLHMSAADAGRYSEVWLSVPTQTQDLREAEDEMLTPTVIDDLLTLAGPISKPPSATPGQVTVEGTLAHNSFTAGSGAGDSTTLAVSTSAPFYPVSLAFADDQNGSTVVTFSNWGERVDLTAPPNAVPLNSLNLGQTTSPVSASGDSTDPAPAITETSPDAGVAVTPTEANTVGTQLWQAWVQARATRDVTALQTLDTQPELAADYGAVCNYGCKGPQLTLGTISVIVPRQTSWPARFLATAAYTTNCDASASPCNNTFVAVQSAPHAPWQIAAMASWSGSAYATTPTVPAGQFSPAASPSPAAHVTTLPQEYAAYLEAIKTTGQAPPGTRLGPGPFTSDLIATNYNPASAQQAAGNTETVTYTVSPSDPIWQFAGSYGATAVCGTVRYRDVTTATTVPLVQSDENHPYGNLGNGIYSSVTVTGLHTVCFESYSDPTEPVAVIGTWGDTVSATGTAIQARLAPA